MVRVVRGLEDLLDTCVNCLKVVQRQGKFFHNSTIQIVCIQQYSIRDQIFVIMIIQVLVVCLEESFLKDGRNSPANHVFHHLQVLSFCQELNVGFTFF